MTVYTFRKEEKLCSQKIIGDIFLSGTSFPAQVVFSVPKRLFKRAHDRNLLKRQLREVYRHQKQELYLSLELNNRKVAVMIVYIAKEKLEFGQIESAMTKVISKLQKKLEPLQLI